MKNFHGVEGYFAGAVLDLVTATGAGSGDQNFLGLFSNGGKEDEFADLHGDFVGFGLVAEGSGHAAAAGGNEVGLVAFGQGKGADGGVDSGEGFLVAMAVQLDGFGFAVKLGDVEASGLVLAYEEFFDKQGVLGESSGGVLELGRGEIEVLVAEAEDGGGLDAEQRCCFADGVLQQADILIGDLAGPFEQSLRERGASAFVVLGDGNGVAEAFEQLDSFDADWRVVIVGEFVAEEQNFADFASVGVWRVPFAPVL